MSLELLIGLFIVGIIALVVGLIQRREIKNEKFDIIDGEKYIPDVGDWALLTIALCVIFSPGIIFFSITGALFLREFVL